jgi:hypothetical protein
MVQTELNHAGFGSASLPEQFVPTPLAVRRLRCYIGTREAAARVRSHISPGPYRSFRELSLAGSVDPDIWCPPTFVGNSGIERSNGVGGFALSLRFVIPRGVST